MRHHFNPSDVFNVVLTCFACLSYPTLNIILIPFMLQVDVEIDIDDVLCVLLHPWISERAAWYQPRCQCCVRLGGDTRVRLIRRCHFDLLTHCEDWFDLAQIRPGLRSAKSTEISCRSDGILKIFWSRSCGSTFAIRQSCSSMRMTEARLRISHSGLWLDF